MHKNLECVYVRIAQHTRKYYARTAPTYPRHKLLETSVTKFFREHEERKCTYFTMHKNNKYGLSHTVI